MYIPLRGWRTQAQSWVNQQDIYIVLLYGGNSIYQRESISNTRWNESHCFSVSEITAESFSKIMCVHEEMWNDMSRTT